MVKIQLNGEDREIAGGTSVRALLDSLGFKPEITVVERNASIVDRGAFGDTVLADGDRIELVRFVGGG